ncbi:MAG: carbamoyl phosphate synthase small subunit [Eubacteriales bacterium]|nr:carbamoyl phosphate synthase small subunit [Eubacteriales bacterium]
MAYLVLQDGTVYEGSAFGRIADITGEVVFNTGMTGYQEVLTDPSYCGQIVTMTYPLIGNYGVNWEDPESMKPQVRGFVVREVCEAPSNWHSEGGLNEYLTLHGIAGIQGVDTRALTRKLRNHGTMRGMICENYPGDDEFARMSAGETVAPVMQVTGNEMFEVPGPGPRVAVMDFGLKASILSSLRQRGCHLLVFPAGTSAQEILKAEPDGIMLTNGPGNPKDNPAIIAEIRKLVGKKPIFGICLGHQLMALACGADSRPLRYGHRGCNHPVKDLEQDRVYITSQNHGYTLVEESLPAGMRVSHRNWNDKTIEGVVYTEHASFTVQFHPEASPGPKDTAYLFDRFVALMHSGRAQEV